MSKYTSIDEFHYLVRIYLKSGDVFCTVSLNKTQAVDFINDYKRDANTLIEFRDLDEKNSFGHANRIIVAKDNISYVAIENIDDYINDEDNT